MPKKGAAGWRAGVDRLLGDDHGSPGLLDVMCDVRQIAERATQAVQPRDDKAIARSFVLFAYGSDIHVRYRRVKG